ncbi:GSU2403 family nucleotidyltransferase fold protein [Xanthobacter autotrophicus]|uniref:nucleotidyltransferase family protein n=1 Tax=Xanthobacter autotrophicus TaxID=280 RepID=UPI00372932DA
MAIARHSTIAHAAYLDLIRSLEDEVVSDIRGTPTRVQRGARTYWYDTYRVGSDVMKRYISEDSDELRARLERLSELRRDAAERRKQRSRLIRILRAERFMTVDPGTGSLLASMESAGVFRLGGIIVGTHAFRLYEGELGVTYGFEDAAMTDDLDIASFERLSLALADTVSPTLQQVLSDFSFEPVLTLEPEKVWRWRQTRSNLLVEFLTPSFENEEGLKPLAALGVYAQSLHYLNYLVAEPINAAVPYRSGVLVRIPRPERFAIHKLIVADRRQTGPDSLKSVKDRRQAAFLIRILAEDRPDDLAEAHEVVLRSGSNWRKRLEASLSREPEIAEILTGLGK